MLSLFLIIYIAWRGSKPSDFFSEALPDTYPIVYPEAEINMYYDLKDKMQIKAVGQDVVDGSDGVPAMWAQKLEPEERLGLQQALMRRLVKTIDILDKVQRDKPGNWKMWRGKLVTENFWNSLCEAERIVGEEVDQCLAEAEELEPGWREHIFQQAVQFWRMDKHHKLEKKEAKKVTEKEKKNVKKEEERKVNEVANAEKEALRQEKAAEKAMEKLLREEENASKKDKAKAKEKPKAKKK